MSTERALLIRTALDAGSCRFFAVGMDYPSVRIFDTATGELAAVVEAPKRLEAIGGSVLHSAGGLSGSAFAVSLSSVAITPADSIASGVTLVAAGLSDGTVVLHNVTKDERIAQVCVSDTHQAIIAMAFSGDWLLCLTKGGGMHVVAALTGQRVTSMAVEVPQFASSLATSITPSGERLLLAAGPISTVFELSISAVQHGEVTVVLTPRSTFCVQASSVDFSWISDDGKAAVTCGAQEAVIRVWDLPYDGTSISASKSAAVCKRMMPVGRRVGHLRVSSTPPSAASGAAATPSNWITATTFFGEVMIWDLGATLTPRVADPLPVEPTVVLTSAHAEAKLLVGDVIPSADGSRQLLTVRGRFALPRFDGRAAGDIVKRAVAGERNQQLGVASIAAYSKASSKATAAIDIDNEWASHHATVSRAAIGAAEEFPVPKDFAAQNVQSLPSSKVTTLERLAEARDQQRTTDSAVLGSITVPLYQALHAGDTGLVMELLSITSRSDAELEQCVLALQMPYVMQLLKILSERVKLSNSRSPLYRWISAIIQLRGAEMHAKQREWAVSNGASSELVDAPKTYIAPLLAQYRSMTSLFDRLSLAYGRLSIFRSVNPASIMERKHSRLVHTETAVADGIFFPQAFRIVDRGNGTSKVMIVRSKRERQALRARRRARRPQGSKPAAGDSDDDEADDDELSMGSDELDAMMESGEMGGLSLDEPTKKSRRITDRSVIANEAEGALEGDDDDGDDDLEEDSDELVDSGEEDEELESDVDSSPYEEDDEEVTDDDDVVPQEGDDDDDEGSDDDDDDDAGEEDDNGYQSMNLGRRSQAERRVRTD